MVENKFQLLLIEQKILNKIYILRGQKIMLDVDLTEIYKAETRRLNDQVKRNINRFSKDFMFSLSEKEYKNLMSQNAISSWGGRNKLSRHRPLK